MLHLPDTGFKVFEVAIYNKDVRALVRKKLRHSFFDNHWARTQVRDVVARDEDEAIELITQRFPEEDGFVVKRVHESRY